MSENLNPCPFCGGEDLSVHFDDGFSCYVWCGDCGSKTDNRHPTKKEAIKAWNTRPAEDALKAEVERLKNELGIQKNLTGQMCFENKRAYNEVEEWKKMFYDLCDKQAGISTDPKVIVINPDTGKGGEDEL